jgi:hypothetical protein
MGTIGGLIMAEKDYDAYTFEDKPEDFPEVWEPGDDDSELELELSGENYEISVSIPTEKLINKHVYLAIQEYLKDDSWFVLSVTENKTFDMCVGISEYWTKSFDFEAEVMQMFPFAVSKDEFKEMAASLERCAAHLRKIADEEWK